MSGVPMPLSSRVAVPEGGKLAGIRTIVVSIPRASSASQNGVPWRSSSTRPAWSGNCHRPSVSRRPGGTVREVERNDSSVSGWRWMKSKMPCSPGSRPVMNVDHATGLCGGVEVASGVKRPPSPSRARLGSRPWPIRSRTRW